MSEKRPFKIYAKPGLQSSSLVVGWSEDAGKLGTKVIDYLNKKLGCEEFAEIEPEAFFPLGGVSVQDNVAQFPGSKFYCCQEKNLVIFESNSPGSEWYRFLEAALDVSEQYCQVKELYTIGSMISASPHTVPRELLAAANSSEMKRVLSQYGLARDVDYETPPGQRPTLNSFLLWLAKRRNIAGVGLWVPVPFYLLATEDPQSWRKIVEFFDRRFQLEIDLRDLDEEVARQNEKIAQLRTGSPEVDDYIQRLENNLGLTSEESENLIQEIEGFLRKRD